MKKRLLTLVSISLIAFSLSAASLFIGAEAGGDLNFIRAGKGYREYQYKPYVGASLALPVSVELTDYLTLDASARFVWKNYQYQREATKKNSDGTTTTAKTIDFKLRNVYFELPVTINYSFLVLNEESKLFVGAGGYIGYWVSSSRKGGMLDEDFGKLTNVSDHPDLSHSNRFQYGLIARGGYIFDTESFRNIVSIEYDFALSSLNKNAKVNNFPTYNSSVTVAYSLLWRAL